MTISRRVSWDGKPLAANTSTDETAEAVTDDEEWAGDPAGLTIDEVLAYVEEHPDERERVIDAETAGKGRVTLLAQLNDDTSQES